MELPLSFVLKRVILGAITAAGVGSCSLAITDSEEKKTATLEVSAFEATKAGFLTQSILSITVKPGWSSGSAKLKLAKLKLVHPQKPPRWRENLL